MGLLIICSRSKLYSDEAETSELVHEAASCGKRVNFMKIFNTKVMVTSPDHNFGALTVFTDDTAPSILRLK